jgi:hypothetical protein
MINKIFILVITALFPCVEAFLYQRKYTVNNRISLSHLSSSSESSWRHYDPEYIKALQEAAKDPKKFEEFTARQSKIGDEIQKKNEHHEQDMKSLHSGGGKTNSTGSLSNQDAKKKGYVPIEQWDKEQKELLKQMSWEQRVQYEGQRNGDQFRQNEILRKNLKTF